MFDAGDRDRVRDHVLALARADARVLAAAAVGGTAADAPDRWSDLDLTFAVGEAAHVDDVLADWTENVARTFGAVHLFDLPAFGALYRVLLLPGSLQVDLSVAPLAQWGARGPRFRLLWGEAREQEQAQGAPPRHVLGLALHHAVRARIAVERGRRLQAVYWLGGARDLAVELACTRLGLPASYARGADDLPPAARRRVAAALPSSLDREALLDALAATVDLLLEERGAAPELEPALRELRQSVTTAAGPAAPA